MPGAGSADRARNLKTGFGEPRQGGFLESVFLCLPFGVFRVLQAKKGLTLEKYSLTQYFYAHFE
jgi:hypothetical protein